MHASAALDDCVITLSVADVSKTFKQVNMHKATGPDRLPGHGLRACADQLARDFTNIFNLSLIESVTSICFKQTTIVPVPKKVKVTYVNDYHPLTLTSVATKCFERQVMAHINTIIPENPRPSPICIPPQQIQMTQSQSYSTLPFTTWTKGTTVQGSTP